MLFDDRIHPLHDSFDEMNTADRAQAAELLEAEAQPYASVDVGEPSFESLEQAVRDSLAFLGESTSPC